MVGHAMLDLPRGAPAFAARLALLLALVLGLGACGKADRTKCERMCRNYATITFRDVEAARLPPEKREPALQDKLTRGMEFCVNKCQAANNDDQIDCATAAKNITELRTCD